MYYMSQEVVTILYSNLLRSIYCSLQLFPSPSFEIHFFPPTNKFAAGGELGTQKAIFKAFSRFLYNFPHYYRSPF